MNSIVAVMIVMLCLTTWQHKSVWSSEISLWKDVTEKSPGRARAWNNLGAAHIKRGQFKEAIPAYLHAIELLASYEIPYLNLMICYNQMESFSSTLLIREKLLQASPAAVENVQVLYQEALARFGLKQLEQA
jgi:tetratricopeptide (TPR) repeat protein